MERLTGPLTDALARQRESLNSRFAEARRSCSTLDATAFSEHLAMVLDPIVRQVAKVFPEKVDAATVALFGLSLDLFVARLLGPEAKTPWIVTAWRELLPTAATQVAREPDRLAACVSNAVFNLAGTPGARPRQWLDGMLALAGNDPSVSQLLDCGKVLAWRAGMAQYRAAALEVAAALPPALAAAALELPRETSPQDVSRAIGRLKADLWLTSRTALRPVESALPLRIIARAGAFRGFGGLFLRPPTVSVSAGAFYVADGEGVWQMLADAYGVVFVRAEKAPTEAVTNPRGPTVDRHGHVRWGNDQARFPQLAELASCASDQQTLAVTLPTSHHVFLLARAAEI